MTRSVITFQAALYDSGLTSVSAPGAAASDLIMTRKGSFFHFLSVLISQVWDCPGRIYVIIDGVFAKDEPSGKLILIAVI